MTKRNISDHSYTQSGSRGKLYVLKLSGFWGNLIAIAMLLLLLPLVATFFLFFIVGIILMAVIGVGYVWWNGKKLQRRHASYEEDTIELAASEYQSLDEPRKKARDTGDA